MNALQLLLILAVTWQIIDCEKSPHAAIDKRFKLTNLAKLKRVLRQSGPREEPYALPRQPLVSNGDQSAENNLVNMASTHQRGMGTSQEKRRPAVSIHRITTSERKERMVKNGRRTGPSHRKDINVIRTTTAIPLTIASRRRSLTTSRPAWSLVPYVIATSSGESKQSPHGISRSAANNDVIEKSHSGFHTMGSGTTAFRRKILRMIVEQSLARKANQSIAPEVVHVSGVYTDPNNRVDQPTAAPDQHRKLLPGYPRPSRDSPHHSHENQVFIDLPRSREASPDSEEAFEPVFQVQPATRIHEDSNELATTSVTTTLRRVEIQRPTTMIIHRKPPHAPPVFLRPTEMTPPEVLIDPPRDDEYLDSTQISSAEDDEDEVTLSPYARSKLLRYAHRQRKRRVRQDDSIPSKFLQESLACRYCYVYWKRQDIQPRDIFTFCLSVAAPLIHGCYFSNWAVYRPEPAKFTPEKIPVGLCTHIFYAFAAVNIATYEARMTDSWSDIDLKSMSGIQAIKKKQPGLKTLLSFGGWTESATGIYAKVASDPAKRSKFVKSAWALANNNGFDGIDLDWEYPDAANKANFVALIKELKAQSGGKLVTAAVSAGAATINAGYDVPAFEKYVDYLTVMSYDFHFGTEPKIAHQGAYSETIAAMNIWNQKGMPKNKLLMGIGAYGRGWNAQTCALGAPGNGAIAAQAVTQEGGYAAYFEIAKMGGRTIQTPEGAFLEATVNGQKVCIGYDDRTSILKKTDFIKKNGFAGAFTWTIDFDGPGFPVHNAIKDGLSGGSVAPAPSGPTRVPAPSHGPAPAATTTKTVPAPVPAPSGGKCTDGTMRANANKGKYDQCQWGSWQTRDCPPGTVFDPATNNFRRA